MSVGKSKLILLGAGEFAEEALDLVQEAGTFSVVCFVEGIDRSRCAKQVAGIPVVWVEDVAKFDSSHSILCVVGSPKRRNLIAQVSSFGFEFVNFTHPSARISRTARMGKDVFVSNGVSISTATVVGDHVIINRGALIGHHVLISSYVTISPGANIGGGAHMGEGSTIGMGAIVLDHITIGSNSVVGAGAVVTKNVPTNVQVVGIPAHITKTFPEQT